MSDIQYILEERERTHGDFRVQARIARNLKEIVVYSPNAIYLSHIQREAIDMILHKVSRILCGHFDHEDHWDDISGYAQLGKLKNDK
jgi:hypothetical protein